MIAKHFHRFSRRCGGAVLCLALGGPAWLLAQTPTLSPGIVRSLPPPGATSHVATPGDRYRAGWPTSWLFGTEYRNLWTAPVEASVLNLDSVGGGLTPLRTGGFGQSVSLHFTGRDGRRYVVRSVDKDPTKRLLTQLKGTFVEDIVQDQISALHPSAALVVDPLLDATGILHTSHTLVIIPDDPRLGEFRADFAGMLGMLVLHPDEGADDTPGFAGSRRISGTEAFLNALEDGPCDRVADRELLKARLVDMLVGDKDRHAGQWRWAQLPDGDCRVWRPIPEDRDQAFINFDGFAMWVARKSRPQQIKFSANYPSVKGLTFNGWEVDRELLVELSWDTWDSVVADLQRVLTDQVIDDAVRRMPPPHYALTGDFIATALKRRRDDLRTAARRYYRLITRWPDIKATDQDEYAIFEHQSNGALAVQIGLVDQEQRQPPHFQRTFEPSETRELRVYLRGGDDYAEVRGGLARIGVHIEGGAGDDRFVNGSPNIKNKVAFYDSRGDNVFERGRGAWVSEREYERPPATDQAHEHALDWGGRGLTYPIGGYGPDVGLYLAIFHTQERFGFRRDPFAASHTLAAGIFSSGPEPVVAYRGVARWLWPSIDGILEAEYTGINILNFYGFGNDSEADPNRSSDFFKVEQREVLLSPGINIAAGKNRAGQDGAGTGSLREGFGLSFLPVLKWSNTPADDNADKFIGQFPGLYGTGSFGQLGAATRLILDTRDNAGNPKKGINVNVLGTIYPEVWDVEEPFGGVEGDASVFLTAPIPTTPTLALRAGGKKVWGPFPFHEAAYVGGGPTLRGFRAQRFAGDASAFGNAELRFQVAPFRILVPGSVGLFGLVDAGRVWVDGESSGGWHVGYGAGIWFSIINRLQTLSIAVAKGDDLTGLYIRSGFMY